MKVLEKIPFTEINSIPELIKDFLQQNISGFEHDVWSIENLKNKIEEKQKSYSEDRRATLQNVLKMQHSGLELSDRQKKNIDLIGIQNTFTVATGHQLNLFSGPVFFIYKILQTIKTAGFLNEKFEGKNFVPIFWMATEDHDFEEINHFKTKEHYYELNEKTGKPVGEITVSDIHFISQFEEDFKDFTFGTELILMVKEAYQIGKSLSEATRILVNRLFSDHGLLILDGNDKELKSWMRPIFKDELERHSLAKNTAEKVIFLKEKYGKVQVNPREINLFFIDENRYRIDEFEEKYHLIDSGKSFSKDEILEIVETHPEKFSPNALMRPVYQETVLPNIAYIGGNAEVMYWLELKDYFKFLQLPFPVLIPRNSMLFLSEKTASKTNKLQVSYQDLFSNFAEVTSNKILDNNDIVKELSQLETQLKSQFQTLHDAAQETDKSFGNMVDAEETRQLKSFARLQKRLLRAEKIKQNELLQRLENLYLEVHPGKNWQERVFNYSQFYKDEGKSWLETCLRELDVEVSELIVIEI